MAELSWFLIKKFNSFLVKRNGVTFSREPGNLLNKHSPKFSGLCNRLAVDVQPVGAGKKGVVLAKKTKSGSVRKPRSAWNKVTIKRDFRHSAKAISAEVGTYRPDLKKAALARLSAITRVNKLSGVAKKTQKKRTRRHTTKAAQKK
jgi:large subunit ribosomal protein L28e